MKNSERKNFSDKFKREQYQYRIRLVVVLFADVFCTSLSYLLALWIRFDLHFATIPREYECKGRR